MDSVRTFEEFKEILKNYEIKTFSKFNVSQNPKGFLDEKRKISADMRLHWKNGLPYFHFSRRIYTCHLGKDKNLGKKQKYREERQEKSENPTKSKKNVLSAKIRSKLKNNEDLEGEEAFWFTLPSVDAHKNHMQGEFKNERILNGIPLEEQLNDIKNTQSSAEHFQAQKMKKRDISFIHRAFASEVYNTGMNATEYVEQWVRTCSEMENSPILLYRHEGIGTKSEDLMLIIMTEFQKHILMTSSKQVVCLAFPNRNKNGDNLLTALVVMDDQEVAFPVAFCICNRVNKSTMLEFLSSVKESTGPLSFSYFMSNYNKFFYEAWQEVMQDESKWVWSIWSFDDRIRRLFWHRKSAIKDINAREETYRILRTIIECNSQPVFATMLENFKISLLENATTSDFGKYFMSLYDSNPEMWACCYRKDIKLNTNICIEYLFKIMQYCIRITRTIQLHKFLMVVMKWLRFKMLDRLSNMLDEDKINLAKNTISMCHNMGLEIECENVVSLSDKIWLIRSQNDVDVYVTQECESCPELCDLRCSDCDVCVHMYSCSCAQSLIHANMCPHVHAVVWKFLTPHFSPPASPEPDPCADVQTIGDIKPYLLKGVLKRMEGVYKQVRINKSKLNKNSLSEVLRLLNRCYQICSCDENPTNLLSVSTQTESNLQSSLAIKPAAVPGLKLSNISNKTCLTDKLLYVILPDVPPNTGLGLASQTPSVESTTVSVSKSNKDSNVTELSSSHVLPVLLPSVSYAESNFASQTPVIFSNNDSDKSDKIRQIPILSSNSVPNTTFKYNSVANRSLLKRTNFSGAANRSLLKRTNFSGATLLKGSNTSSDPVTNSPFNIKTTVSTSDNLPAVLVNTQSNYVSRRKPVARKRRIERTSVPEVPLVKDSSNISSDPVANSPFNVKTTVSMSDNLPAVSVNTQSNYVSRRKPVAKKRCIVKTCVPDVPLMKDSSNIFSDPVINSPFNVKTTVSTSDNVPAFSVNTQSNYVSRRKPVVRKCRIEGTSVPDVPLMKDSSNVSFDTAAHSPLTVKTENLPALSVSTETNSVSRRKPVVRKCRIEGTSVPDVPLMKDSSNVSFETAAHSPLTVKTEKLPALSVSTETNSVSRRKPVVRKRPYEGTSVPDVPLMKDSSNVSFDTATNSPLIVKTENLPALSDCTESNSVSEASSANIK